MTVSSGGATGYATLAASQCQLRPDPGLLGEVHELATMGHESSRGFHKIEWQRLMFDTEAQATGSTST